MISSKGDTQHSTELSKTRRPRVHLTYDLEVNGAIREVDLPFVVGVLADLSGADLSSSDPTKAQSTEGDTVKVQLKVHRRPINECAFETVDAESFDRFLRRIQPTLSVQFKGDDSNGKAPELTFQEMDDFLPDGIVKQLEPLKAMKERRRQLMLLQNSRDLYGDPLSDVLDELSSPASPASAELQATSPQSSTQAGASLALSPSSPEGNGSKEDKFDELAGRVVGKADRNDLKNQLQAFHESFRKLNLKVNKPEQKYRVIAACIHGLDEEISRRVNQIIHSREFRALEATWRGLKYLVDNTTTSETLKIRVMNVARSELEADMKKSGKPELSVLFKRVYEDEFGTLGGEPFGMLVGGYEFTRDRRDVLLLEHISGVAAAAFAPFIAGATPQILGLKSFEELPKPRDLSVALEHVDFHTWKSFRDSEDSRFAALCLPRVLYREPYDPENNPVDSFQFIEEVYTKTVEAEDGQEDSKTAEAEDSQKASKTDALEKLLWGNTAFVLASRVTAAFAAYGWAAAIRGVEGGGLVEGLPSLGGFEEIQEDTEDEHQGATLFRYEPVTRMPTEVAITDRRERELAELGFVPLVYRKGTDQAAFFSVQSCQKPGKFTTDEAEANARLSTQLPYLFAVSRIAHYLKVMMRDKIGRFTSRSEVEQFLNTWINRYVILDDTASQETRARYPLREARVDVIDDPARPGGYKAVAFLRPHFQLDELTVSLRLVTTLPQPAAA